MIRCSKSITAAGRRFGVVLEQAEDGCLAYPEVSNLDTFAPDTQPAFPSEP
ncbi:MAG: hypothetical protein ACK5Q6_01330 [Cyanobacteriota bacterium]